MDILSGERNSSRGHLKGKEASFIVAVAVHRRRLYTRGTKVTRTNPPINIWTDRYRYIYEGGKKKEFGFQIVGIDLFTGSQEDSG